MLYLKWSTIVLSMKPRIRSYYKERNDILKLMSNRYCSTTGDISESLKMDLNLVLYLVKLMYGLELVNLELLSAEGHPTTVYMVDISPKGMVFLKEGGFPETRIGILWEYLRNNHATIISIIAIAISALALYNGWKTDKAKLKPLTSYPSEPTQNIPSKSSYPDSLANGQCFP